MTVIGTSRVVETLEQAGQIALIAQRQHDGEVKGLGGRKRAYERGLAARDCGTDVIV